MKYYFLYGIPEGGGWVISRLFDTEQEAQTEMETKYTRAQGWVTTGEILSCKG